MVGNAEERPDIQRDILRILVARKRREDVLQFEAFAQIRFTAP